MRVHENWNDWTDCKRWKFVRVRDLAGLPFGYVPMEQFGMVIQRPKSTPYARWQTSIRFSGPMMHPTIHSAGRSLREEFEKVEEFVRLFRAGWPRCESGCHFALAEFDRHTMKWAWAGWFSILGLSSCRWHNDSYCLSSDQRLLANGSIVEMVPAATRYQTPANDRTRRVSLPDDMEIREWDQ